MTSRTQTKRITRSTSLKNAWLKRDVHQNDRENWGNGVLVSGRNLQALGAIAKSIDEAREMVCVSSFILQETRITKAIKSAARRGIRAYLLTASETYLLKDLSESSEYEKAIVNQHKELLNSLSDITLVRTADHLHAKFVLVDPRGSSGKKGFLLTANLTEKAITENLELCIELTPDQVDDLFVQFIKGFWIEAKQELRKRELKPASKSPYLTFSNPQRTVWTIGDSGTLRSALTELVGSAKDSICLTTWSIESDNEVLKLLEKKAKEGVKLRVIIRPSFWNMTSIEKLAGAGAVVRGHPLMHAKSVIVDGNRGIVMTSNITRKGLDKGYEVGILSEAEQVKTLSDVFEDWWENSAQWEYHLETPVDSLTESILMLNERRLVEKPVTDTEIDLGVIVVPEEAGEPHEPKFNWPDEDKKIFRHVSYKWTTESKPLGAL